MKRTFCVALLVLGVLWVGKCVLAQETTPTPIDVKVPFGELYVGEFYSHFQTATYRHAAHINELTEKLIININPQWRLEFLHFQGESPARQDFQTGVNDFEGRIGYRFDDWRSNKRTDGVTRNLYGWISWKRWKSNSIFQGISLEQERDEGMGFGVTRDAESTGFSYFYTAGLYPSVRTSIANQRNAFLISTGPSITLFPGVQLLAGYRYQAIRTDARRARGQEQGLIINMKGTF